MRLVACLRTDFDVEVQHSQLKINHLSDTPSTKAAGGRIFSGVFTQGHPGTTQGQEDFELSWYLFFQQFPSIFFGLRPLFESPFAAIVVNSFLSLM